MPLDKILLNDFILAPIPEATVIRGDGFNAGADFGWAVSSAGDFDGDGIDDVLISAPSASAGAGAVYVVYGWAGAAPSAPILDLSTMTAGVEYTRIEGIDGLSGWMDSAPDGAGLALSSLGDFNGDGFDDIAIGAPGADAPGFWNVNTGEVYVVYGDATRDATLDLADVETGATPGITFSGSTINDDFGGAVSAIGDVNGDGHGDLMIGASGANAGAVDSGAAYIVYGGPGAAGYPTDFNIWEMDANQGFTVTGGGAGMGASPDVSAAGDLNNDGVDDFLIATPDAAGGAGEVYLVWGRDFGAGSVSGSGDFTLDLGRIVQDNLGVKFSGVYATGGGDRAGAAVAGGGDLNGDGIDDLVIGAPRANGGIGGVYVVYGQDLSAAPGVTNAAYGDSGASWDASADYGNGGVWSRTVDLGKLSFDQGTFIAGSWDDRLFGADLEIAQDLNADGIDELIIGSPESSDPDGGMFSGSSYLLFGRADWDFAYPGQAFSPVGSFGAGEGFEFVGRGAFGTSGWSVGATDDGKLIIGAPSANGMRGEAYVYDFNPGPVWIEQTWTNGNDGPPLQGTPGQDRIFALNGNDLVYAGDSADDIFGGGGRDDIYGEGGNDTLRGEGGRDDIWGGIGADSLFGGGDRDVLDGGAGNDSLDGGVGNDRLFGGADNDWLNGGDNNDRLEGGDGADRLIGGNGGDDLFGQIGDDILDGGDGEDDLYGGVGNDSLDGGLRNDRLYGGDGVDRLEGGAGNDRLYGGEENDRLFGGDNNDRLYGDNGADILDGGNGEDRLYGGNGNDSLDGGLLRDRLYGGDGDDVIEGGGGNDLIRGDNWGQTGNDRIFGGEGNDDIEGRNGDDVIDGGIGNDDIDGGAGADIITGGEGDDRLNGGGGTANDTVYGGDGEDRINTSNGDDLVDGGDQADNIRTRAGDDRVFGGAGNDDIRTDSGADWIDAGDGDDRIRSGVDDDIVFGGGGVDRVTASWGEDTIYGGAGADELEGEGEADTIYGGDQSDLVDGGDGHDLLFGDAGADRLFGRNGWDEIYGGLGVDELFGGRQNDTLYGGDEADLLDGGRNNDTLFGGAGADMLDGDRNNDIIVGGAGDDILTGGNQDDIFRFAAGDGADVITDFDDDDDLIDLTAYGFTTNTDFASTQIGADVFLDFNGTDSVLLQGFSLADLNDGDFLF